jgi:hypothetical protein
LDVAGFVIGQGQGQTSDLDKGLVYLYQRDLLVTGNFWNIIVNIDLEWYRYQIDAIHSVSTDRVISNEPSIEKQDTLPQLA